MTSSHKLLDLFCGAGGSAKGYDRAGFTVVGVDIEPQPNYPYEFHQLDALGVLEDFGLGGSFDTGWALDDFDVIHASPPCQAYTTVTLWRGDQGRHVALIDAIRRLLAQWGRPYVIENTRRSGLLTDYELCGTMFGLPIRRHRCFETNWPWFPPPGPCRHHPSDYAFDHGVKQPESMYRDAMGCEWMTTEESREAIPPVMTEWLGLTLQACFAEGESITTISRERDRLREHVRMRNAATA